MESRGLDNQLHMKDDKEAVSMGHMMAFGLGYQGGWECDGKERSWIQFERAEFDVSMGNYGKMPGRAGNVSLTSKREVRAGF